MYALYNDKVKRYTCNADTSRISSRILRTHATATSAWVFLSIYRTHTQKGSVGRATATILRKRDFILSGCDFVSFRMEQTVEQPSTNLRGLVCSDSSLYSHKSNIPLTSVVIMTKTRTVALASNFPVTGLILSGSRCHSTRS